jgi:hypothetical protein
MFSKLKAVKKILLLFALTTLTASFSFAQTNTYPYPSTGNLGIGTGATAPSDAKVAIQGTSGTSILLKATSSDGSERLNLSSNGALNLTGTLNLINQNGDSYGLLNDVDGVVINSNILTLNASETYTNGYYTAVNGYYFGIDGSRLIDDNTGNTNLTSAGGINFNVSASPWGGSNSRAMTILADGRIGIGASPPGQYKFAVNGDAIFTKIKVKPYAGWPDYVFKKNYKLPTLKEVERYIKQYGHLPGIKSAEEVERESLDVGESQAALLKKIEEMTLYMIEVKNQLEMQAKKIKQQTREIKAIKARKKQN